jgi:hypothetical protein
MELTAVSIYSYSSQGLYTESDGRMVEHLAQEWATQYKDTIFFFAGLTTDVECREG